MGKCLTLRFYHFYHILRGYIYPTGKGPQLAEPDPLSYSSYNYRFMKRGLSGSLSSIEFCSIELTAFVTFTLLYAEAA